MGSSTYLLRITPEWGDITHVLSMTLNCSIHSPNSLHTMTNLDNNYNADLMDAMADQFEEEQEAMRETEPQEWEGYDDQT